jgi:hypothetical protein
MSIDKFIEAEIRRQVEEEVDPVRRDILEVGDEVETVDYNLIRLKERVAKLEDAQMKFSVGAIKQIVLRVLEENIDVKVTLGMGGDE